MAIPPNQPPNSAWFPSQGELNTPPALQRTIQTVLERVYALQKSQATQAGTTQAATAQLVQATTPQAIAQAIAATGPAPADLTGLVGRTRSNQYAYVPKFSIQPKLSDPSATSGDGTLITVSSNPLADTAGVLYRFNQKFDDYNIVQTLGIILFDTHANRLANYDPTKYEPGTLFFETDRHVLYIVEVVTGTNAWKYLTGTFNERLSNEPSDLGVNDAGFRFHAADVGKSYLWTGVSWQNTTELAVILFDTHANRLANYDPTTYPPGTVFFETNFQVLYIVQVVATVNVWSYLTGVYSSVFANRPTLGANDFGYRFYAIDQGRSYLWDTANWLNVEDLGVVLRDTFANMLANFAVGDYAKGVLFWCVDRTVFYQNDSAHWIYSAGAMVGLDAAKPGSLGAQDVGFLYIATDISTLYYWNGTAYVSLSGAGGGSSILAGTHAVRLSTFPASGQAVDTLFWETDRSVFYIVQIVSGSHAWVFASGTYNDIFANRPTGFAVTDANFRFHAQDTDGQSFLWNGSAWVNTTETGLTLRGTHSTRLAVSPSSYAIGVSWYETDRGVTYISDGTNWNYASGQMLAPVASAPSLGANDAGFEFQATDTQGRYYWNGGSYVQYGCSFPLGDIAVPGHRVKVGIGQLSGGVLTVATGLSSLNAVLITLASGATPSEFLEASNYVGGSFDVKSSNVASTSFFSWLAYGF